jgi:putative membrane protein
MKAALCFVIGAVVAYVLTDLPMRTLEPNLMLYFAAGFVAISAMLLPGISGSFILLMFGLYEVVINALKTFAVVEMGCFVAGCVMGLIVFSKVIQWLLKKVHDLMLMTLMGIMLGALHKIWPWQLEIPLGESGGKAIVKSQVTTPATYAAETGLESFVVLSLVGFVAAFVFYIGLSVWAHSAKKQA